LAVRSSREDRIFNIVNYSLLVIILLLISYPLFFVIIASISDPVDVSLGRVWLWPVNASMEGYRRILAHSDLWTGYRNTIYYTVAGTALNLALTLTGAYSLSRKDLPGRNIFMKFIVFTMFFSGGLIPTYLLINNLGLYNTFWVIIIINAVSVYNLIVARTFFQNNIPDELLEAARIDSCNDIKFFLMIVLPVSKAIIAVLVIFYAVTHWNSYYNGLIYLRDRNRFPLQIFLREILIQNQFGEDMQVDDPNELAVRMIANTMKYGVIIVASVPVLILYPFLQKYFMKGVMIGAIKG